MKTYPYIATVLSHITDKRKKAKIEYELFDHLDEKEKWLEEIGYDEETAGEKAGSYMGDGDIVGEQLDMIRKPFFIRHFSTALDIISLAGAITAYALLFHTELSASLGRVHATYVFSMSYFLSFLLFSTVFSLGAMTMAVGLKRRSIFALCAGFISAEAVIVIGPYHYLDVIESIANHESITDIFYETEVFENVLFNMTFDLSVYAIPFLLFSSSLLAAFICGLVILVKTQKLQNTKKDLKIKGILTYLLMLVCLVAVCFTVSRSVQTVREKEARVHTSTEKIAQAEAAIIENIADLTVQQADKQQAAFEKVLDACDMQINYDMTYHDTLVARSDGADIQMYQEFYEDEGVRFSEIFVESTLVNPFGFNSDSFALYNDNNLKDVKTIDDVPLPAYLSVSTEEAETTLTFTYHNVETIKFRYDRENGKFKLIYNSENDNYDNAALTNKQVKQFKEAIQQYDLPDVNAPTLWLQIYGAYYNEVTDTYLIEYSYLYYRDVPEANSYEASVYKGGGALGCQSPVKFTADGAEILWNESEMHAVGTFPDDMYHSTADLIKDIEGYYSEKSISKIKNEGLIENLTMIIYRYNTNSYYLRVGSFAPFGDYEYNGAFEYAPDYLPDDIADFKTVGNTTYYLTRERVLYYLDESEPSMTPIRILSEVNDFDLGEGYAVALRGDNLYFWGESKHCESGKVSDEIKKPKVIVKDVKDIAAAPHTLAYITFDDTLYTMGDNTDGLLGNGTTENKEGDSPCRVTGNCTIVGYRENANTFSVIKNDNSAYYWGGGKYLTLQKADQLEMNQFGLTFDTFNTYVTPNDLWY